jgi:hypothetical protein
VGCGIIGHSRLARRLDANENEVTFMTTGTNDSEFGIFFLLIVFLWTCAYITDKRIPDPSEKSSLRFADDFDYISQGEPTSFPCRSHDIPHSFCFVAA